MDLIPSIDILNGQVVRLKYGKPENLTIYGNDPIKTAQYWVEQGAKKLHIVDLDNALGNGDNIELIHEIIKSIKIKIQVGGGIRDKEKIFKLFNLGVNKIILGTLIIKHPEIVTELKSYFNTKKIILALDYEDQQVKIEGWKNKTNYNVVEQLRNFRNMGVKEFLLTSVERDGVLTGPDIKLLSKIRKINDIEIIASAGIRNVDDILTLNKMGINGVIIGRALYDKKIIFSEIIKKLEKDGIS